MSSIANRKFTDMKQIEFQQQGSSEISTMLTQPLLENSSTYMCEVTDLQCTIGRELVFPKNEWLFSIVRRPIHENVAHIAFLDTSMLKKFISSREGQTRLHNNLFGAWQLNNAGLPIFRANHWMKKDAPQQYSISAIPDELRNFYDVYSGRHYSTMDFVYNISRAVYLHDKVIEFDRNAELPLDEQKDTEGDDPYDVFTDEMYHIGVACDSGGRLVFSLSEYFRRNYMIVTSKIFQKTTGFGLFIGEYSTEINNQIIHTYNDLINYNPTRVLTPAHLVTYTGVAANLAGLVMTAYAKDLTHVLDVGSVPLTTGPTRTQNPDIIPVQDGVDIRKKVIVEVSLPVSHTLAWNGQKESTRYVLQEFNFPSQMMSMGFDNAVDFSKSRIRYKEKALHGEMVLLNGGSTMALKKLNEGQMQAFRVSLLIEIDEWNRQTNDFVRVKRPMNIESGGFFYMKLLFTKETI